MLGDLPSRAGAVAFVADLHDPSAPAIVGSTTFKGSVLALYAVDDTHLLAVGDDTTPDPRSFGGLRLQLFDASDPTSPHATDSVGIAGRPPYPDDVKSIGFDAASGLLRVPVRQEATGPSQAFPPFEMRVFDVSAERGLTELPAAEKLGIGSPARRTFVLDDDLYPVRFNNVSAYGLPAFDELARLPLPSYYAGRFAWP